MLKKVVIMIIAILAIFGAFSTYAITGEDVLNSEQATELVEMREKILLDSLRIENAIKYMHCEL